MRLPQGGNPSLQPCFELPRELVTHIIQFLPWSAQIAIMPELREQLLPTMATKIKAAIKRQKERITRFLNEEEAPDVNVLKAAYCLYRESDQHRASDIYQVTRSPHQFSRKVVTIISIGICLELPIRKLHKRMIYQMTEAELAFIGW